MKLFNSLTVFAKISLVILVLKLTISVNNGEVRVVEWGRVASKVICQGTTFTFKCKNSSLAMVIFAASYGRQEDGQTLCPFRKDLVDQSVIQANDTDDNSECKEKNVTTEIMKLCDKKRRCIVTVNETYFGNHCKGIYKFLKIIYACGVQITIQVNGTNYTLPNGTDPITVKSRIFPTTGKGPSPKGFPSPRGASSGAPVVMEQGSPAAVMGVAGSLYLWFLHMKENKSAYITVFILSALGAALIMVGVVSCFLTIQKKKEFLRLDIMHKPKRVIAPPKEVKTKNQNGHVLGKDVKIPDGEEAPDGMVLHKGPEVVFTAHDVNNQVKKEFNIDRYSGMENGTAHKGEATGIHINPMFKSDNNNKNPSAMINQNPTMQPVNDTVSSLPSTPARGRTQSEPRSGTPRRTRANSTGNVSRSHERHQNQGMLSNSEERVRLPRHLSAGNVSHQHRHAGHLDNVSQNQSPARTLPRQRSATANEQYCQSPVRNPLHLQQVGNAKLTTAIGTSSGGVICNASHQQSPGNSSVPNQHHSNSSTLNNRQQSQISVSQQLSPSRNPPYDALGQSVGSASGTVGIGGDPHYQGSPLSFASGEVQPFSVTQHSLQNERANPISSMKLSNSSSLGKELSPGRPGPYSSHRSTPKTTRKRGEEKPFSDIVPNIATNPNYNNTSEDIWQKHNETELGQKEPSARSMSSDHSNMPEGILQRRRVSSETSPTQEQDSSKGTLRPPSMGELLSPLDVLPDAYASNSSLRFSNNPGTSSLHSFPPPPPEQPTDSSDDDLYSIVAKGTYSSAVPDPYLRHCAGAASGRREGKNKNKHVYVVVPSGDGSTAV